VAAAPTERIPLFVRGGAIIPSQQEVQYTGQAPIDPLTLDVYPNGTSSRPYYEDDGISFDYQHGVYLRLHVTATQTAQNIALEISAREGSYTPPKRSLEIKIHRQTTEPRHVTAAGAKLAKQASPLALRGSGEGWAWDEDAGVVWIRVPDQGTELKLEVAQ
jgi:alpha-glucosidase